MPIANGNQLGGSCNPAPMGQIPSTANLPSVRISQPGNGQTLAANTSIELTLSVSNLHAGVSVNAASNYMSAPQQLDSTGNILGNYHVVVEELDALNSTTPLDNEHFIFFAVIKDPLSQGSIESSIPTGLPEGFYRVTVTTRAANHQPVIVPISQHGSLNDAVYFTVTADGTARSTPSVRRRHPMPRVLNPSENRWRFMPRADTDAQSSLTLLPLVIAAGFSKDGQDTPVAGQSGSLTSVNNYINFCATTTQPLTIGGQVSAGFCNPAPMGLLPVSTRMPSSKFTYPRNGDILAPNSPMTVGLAVTNFATGAFANPEKSFLSAPQQLDANGLIQGHPAIVFEQLTSPDQLDPTNPQIFSLFKSMTAVADSTGVVTTTVTNGLAAGFYRLSSIIVATNGQPVLLPVLQHGAVDDTIYITIVAGGAIPTNQTALPQLPSSSTSSLPTERSSPSNLPPSTPNPTPASNHVAAAVGGALGGIAVVALLLIGLWFLRRRHKSRAAMMESHPIVLSGSDFGGDPPMAQFSVTPAELNAQKRGREAPVGRRMSTASAAPSYHTQYQPKRTLRTPK
ncbi:hypothetical protein B0H17DRAFT_1192423 [Mycena rosella]|uniref:Uncharacterized protein n=1 Tax=Mycena rosella TaxID=1033263 RepID=A0AAD7M9Q0_MYCRO|nr:hypothetical protein B0H17DRAFT_1192423 [Mycena rosella]